MFQNFCITWKILCEPLRRIKSSSRWSSQWQHRDLNPKTLPKLVYLHNPWTYLQTHIQMLKLRLLWDPEFVQNEFIRGAKQSAVVVSNSIRDQDGMQISSYATPMGFQQITRDMILSRNDTRLKLVQFRLEDIHRAIPLKVSLLRRGGRKCCHIDVAFVAMRNTRDFSDPQESQMIRKNLHKLDKEMNVNYCSQPVDVPHRILYAEIYMRFYRDYAPEVLQNWAVSFYKIISFDILNYDPQ